jgi:predicted peptidase
VAGLHDLAADPVHWHGLGVWRIDGAWWSELRKRLGENQDYPHLTHLPDGYDKDQRAWPLILFLHGSGERGDDLNIVKNSGPIGYINSGHSLPFIVVTPQCPTDEHWDPARLARLIDQVSAANRVDPKRIYVTGLSMGGYGTFELAATYPEKFAAIAPLSGGENPEIAARLKRIPTWIFHGSDDTTVPTRYSVDIAHAMQKLGAPVKLTIYPGVGHGGWADTYANPELYAWLLAHPK